MELEIAELRAEVERQKRRADALDSSLVHMANRQGRWAAALAKMDLALRQGNPTLAQLLGEQTLHNMGVSRASVDELAAEG
jgi:hypothetical protein